jgi:hypothetical protein
VILEYIIDTSISGVAHLSQQLRALLIGMLGPALQAAGVVWDLLEHGVFARGEIGSLTLEHIITGPAHLMMATGLALSAICIPIALQVAAASPEDLARPEDITSEAEPMGELRTAEAAK